MSTFKLSLPTDIPWRRISVSADMLDPILCDQSRPPSFRSSLAAFRYDPADEYQPYPDMTISYVKVVATLGPYSPEIPFEVAHGFLPPEVVDDVEEAFPCYGAVLQVSVAPPTGASGFALSQYPYFIDFEPKKRELYEAVTDTGEILSGSSSNLAVGKSATDTQGTEQYNLDMGGSSSGNAGLFWGLVSAGGSSSTQQEVGTINRATNQTSTFQTTDNSTERREVQSHSTQLSQMYNLFQAFHLGTNRAVFLVEPRPHLRQTEATFVSGPRALEGMQEVFLVIARPKAMADFCVAAVLETAHVVNEPVSAHEKKTRPWLIRLDPIHPEKDAHGHPIPSGTRTGDDVEPFVIPEGWALDKSVVPEGYEYNISASNGVTSPLKVSATPTAIFASFHVQSWGTLHVEVTVYLKTKEATTVQYARRLFLSARDLCTCPPSQKAGAGDKSTGPVDPTSQPAASKGFAGAKEMPWIAFDRDIGSMGFRFRPGPMSRGVFMESRRFSAAVHQEMVRSFNSSRRKGRGELGYADSDAFHARVAGLLAASPLASRLGVALAHVAAIDEPQRVHLGHALGVKTVGDLLRADGDRVARALGIDAPKLAELRRAALRKAAELHVDAER